jgi:hypothetical protein
VVAPASPDTLVDRPPVVHGADEVVGIVFGGSGDRAPEGGNIYIYTSFLSALFFSVPTPPEREKKLTGVVDKRFVEVW